MVEDQLGKNSDSEQGIIKTVKRIFEETLGNIGISTEARAQTLQQNIQTLLKTNSCEDCNLEMANLPKADLNGANLDGATWCNQCVCAAESIGQCVGCPSVDICTGPPTR
ncbi:MAG: hypothetical protein E4H21_11545 [Thermodesulfobacteriales bacterium]|nr:MAG: hypothetical protein E4H21_11545 [Thermodesulfobacteriales bacterium]